MSLTLGKRIKKLRGKITQDAVADRLRMKRTTYATKEQKGDFDHDELTVIAEMLKVELRELLELKENAPQVLDSKDKIIELQNRVIELQEREKAEISNRLHDLEEKISNALSNQEYAFGYLVQIGQAVGLKGKGGPSAQKIEGKTPEKGIARKGG